MSGSAQRNIRIVFCCYAVLLFVATHWPALKVTIPIRRPDLLAHLTVFSIWMTLAVWCGFFGKALSGRNLRVTFIVAVIYAAIDEGLQAIPWLQRNCAWDDYGANVLGIALGVGIALLIRTIARRADGSATASAR
jgi:hypothetical protein